MEQELITQMIGNVSYAALFVWLLWDTRKENRERELKYQQTIETLADNLKAVEGIKEDLEEIKNKFLK